MCTITDASHDSHGELGHFAATINCCLLLCASFIRWSWRENRIAICLLQPASSPVRLFASSSIDIHSSHCNTLLRPQRQDPMQVYPSESVTQTNEFMVLVTKLVSLVRLHPALVPSHRDLVLPVGTQSGPLFVIVVCVCVHKANCVHHRRLSFESNLRACPLLLIVSPTNEWPRQRQSRFQCPYMPLIGRQFACGFIDTRSAILEGYIRPSGWPRYWCAGHSCATSA